MSGRFPLFVVALILPAYLAAQTVEEVGGAAHELVGALGELRALDAKTEEQQQEYERLTELLEKFVSGLEQHQGMTERHFIEASSPMIGELPRYAIRLAEAGLKRFPDSRFLCDHAGFAHSKIASDLAPCAAQLTELRAAELSFRNALGLSPDTFHAHVGIYQVLSLLDKCDEALEQFDVVMQDETGKNAVPQPWRHRASLLLRAGRAEEAVELLTGGEVPAGGDASILLLRAHALAGDAKATKSLASKLAGSKADVRVKIAAADALFCVKRKSDALKILRTLPKSGEFKNEEERVRELLLDTAAAMKVIWNARSFQSKGPLRRQLTKALDLHILVFDGTATPPKETDLSSSPAMLGQVLANLPATAEKDFGYRALQVLCVRAMPAHEPGELEAMLLGAEGGQRVPDEADIPAIFLAMRYDLGDPDQCGVLTGLRALDKLKGEK